VEAAMSALASKSVLIERHWTMTRLQFFERIVVPLFRRVNESLRAQTPTPEDTHLLLTLTVSTMTDEDVESYVTGLGD
jgi:hypothetical protein